MMKDMVGGEAGQNLPFRDSGYITRRKSLCDANVVKAV